MNALKKIKVYHLLIIFILLYVVGLCFAAWDNDLPADNSAWNDAAGMIRANWDALEAVLGVDLVAGMFQVDVRAFGATGDGVTDDRTAIQAAIDSLTSGGIVFINENCAVKSDITLLDNITITMGPKGKLTIPADATITEAVLYSNGKSNVVFDSITIDAGATAGVFGIYLYNADVGVIRNCILTKCRIKLHSLDNTVDRNLIVENNIIDLDSYIQAGIYVSGVSNVIVRGNSIKDGKEGIGIYNGSRWLRISDNVCHGMSQDGIVNISGHDIQITDNHCYSNGQSGICLQRISAYTDSRKIIISGNVCYDNTADGLDLNGGTYSNLFEVVASNNILYSNTGCGIYVTNGHSLVLSGNFCYSNSKQGIFLNGTNRGMLYGNVCSSNASAIGKGNNKAGILLYNTDWTTVIGCVSSNQHGSIQDYGLSETGTTTHSTIIGGYYQNNVESAYMVVNRYSILLGVEAIPRTIQTLANEATPTVLSYYDSETFLTGGTTTITDFDSGVTGQEITIIAEHSLTITDGTNIFLSGSVNWAMTATDTLTLICKADNKWYEISRGDNGA